ncbi:MAG TPA: hypothetical protein VI895_03390 [Bdellovibrionota bacterium]|nr:hypothetical protein [Bdellovibrionota bacterium]
MIRCATSFLFSATLIAAHADDASLKETLQDRFNRANSERSVCNGVDGEYKLAQKKAWFWEVLEHTLRVDTGRRAIDLHLDGFLVSGYSKVDFDLLTVAAGDNEGRRRPLCLTCTEEQSGRKCAAQVRLMIGWLQDIRGSLLPESEEAKTESERAIDCALAWLQSFPEVGDSRVRFN